MFVTLAVRLRDVLPRRDKLYFRQPCGLFHPAGEPISHGHRAGILRNAGKRVGNERSVQRGVPSETASPCFLSLELGLIYVPARVDIPALARERLAGEARGNPVGKQRTRRRAEYRRWHGTHGVA